ncbi:MAG: hypothetical protein IIC53_02425 [Proteobacteria bacterium]|nr:hypothetical protein [Pseudomonadota bacterium]
MSQHDFNVANQGFPALRADVNNALVALAENSSGAGAPSTTFANMLWADTTAGLLKMRNQANNAWITVGKLDAANLDLQFASGTLMLFQQSAAPVGWTKQTAHHSKALRVVGAGTFDGSGGTNSFKNIFGAGKTAGATTLTESQMPAHTHDLKFNSDGIDTGAKQRYVSGGGSTQSGAALATGGSVSHNHTLSLDLQYVDVIIASKD